MAGSQRRTAGAPRLELFATCAPGIEPILHQEVRGLKLAQVEQQKGGVYFVGSIEDVWRANLELRTAIRVLLRVARFTARDADELYRGVQEVDWSRYLECEGTLLVDAHARDSELTHTRFLEQRVKDAVVDQFRARTGERPSVAKEDPDLGIYLHLFKNRATVLLDTSGGSLHKRGWRRRQGRAPLAETTAAAMLLASGWDRRAPLLDPFCGSATILVEAALLAADVAPGSFRERFGFERWRGHDRRAFAGVRGAALARARRPPRLILQGSDASADAIAGARENAAAAGVADWLQLEVEEIARFAPRRGWNAWIVSNPPYGERVGERRELGLLYRRFAAVLAERCAGFEVCLLSGNPELRAALPWKPHATRPLQNGALECELLQYHIEQNP